MKERKNVKQLEKKLGLFCRHWLYKPLCEMKLFSSLMCGIITPLTLSIILIQCERSLQRLQVCTLFTHASTHTHSCCWLTDGNPNQLRDFKTRNRFKANFYSVRCQTISSLLNDQTCVTVSFLFFEIRPTHDLIAAFVRKKQKVINVDTDRFSEMFSDKVLFVYQQKSQCYDTLIF